MEVEVTDNIFVCRDCIYADVCGDPDRTVNCRGMVVANVLETETIKDVNKEDVK